MPTGSTAPKYLSELFVGPVPFEGSTEANYSTATVTIEAVGANLDIEAIGTPLVYDAANSGFVPYVAQDISAVTTSSLPDEAPVCVTLGPATGVATESSNLEATTGNSVDAIVLFRGSFVINKDGLETAGITQPNVDEFVVQMEKQGVRSVQNAIASTSSFVDYS